MGFPARRLILRRPLGVLGDLQDLMAQISIGVVQ